MRTKYLLIIGIFCGSALIQCKSGKATTSTATSGAASALEIAVKRWPASSAAELDLGKTIYEGKCQKCHGDKGITKRDEQEWLNVLEPMSANAELTEQERTAVTHYILATRDAAIMRN